jgi:predicted nucleic acid-binding protein
MSAPIWVLDTNVVVSGLLCAHGPPARLLDALVDARLRLAFDDRIEAE